MKKFLGIGILFVLSGCSASFSFSGASIPADAKSVSVQYFQNNAPLAGPTMSQTFTDALRDYLTSQSHLPLVQNGDLDFTGTISNFFVQPVAATAGAPTVSSLTRLTMTIEVTFSDKNDPKKNFTASFTRFADYSSSQSLTAVQSDLITQIDKQLVQDVFDKAFNNW